MLKAIKGIQGVGIGSLNPIAEHGKQGHREEGPLKLLELPALGLVVDGCVGG